MSANDNILTLRSVTKNFGGVQAVRDVSIDIAYGERHLIIGTNGAGKSTLFNLICGDFPPTSGSISLFGKDVSPLNMRQRSLLGMRRTYQATALFNNLTVQQNFYLALLGEKPMIEHLRLFMHYKNTASYSEKIQSMALEVGLHEKLNEKVSDISHGERRQLEFGLALICRPKFLLLDEPSSGLSASERQEILNLLQKLDREITLLLVEHNMELAFAVASKVTVMHHGEVVCEGSPEKVRSDNYVQEIYLGGKKA